MDGLPERSRLQASTAAPVAGRLLASWQRSEKYGVPYDEVRPVFTGTVDDDSPFLRCGRLVIADLQRTLATEPVSAALTDADGLVLDRVSGDHALLEALDSVHFAPGFSYSERAAGTNGVGLALADRMPTIVRGEQHYSLELSGYTCATAPVLDLRTGLLLGSLTLTTWSSSSPELLLALARSAAGNTAALMLARTHGRQVRPVPRREVFRMEGTRSEAGAGTLDRLSESWRAALAQAGDALDRGHAVAAVGEPGAGRSTLLAQALRGLRPRDRILAASAPAPEDAQTWLSLWTPELAKPQTAVVVRDADALPAWAAERLRDLVVAAGVPIGLTAERFEDLPGPIAGLVGSVVPVAALRDRAEDVVPLARHAAERVRGRPVAFTPAAERALSNHSWPGNVGQLVGVVREAATRADTVDVRHLPPEVLSGTTRRLSRIEAFERDEIVRVLSRPDTSMKEAAEELGMSRATIYRKISQYDLHLRGQ